MTKKSLQLPYFNKYVIIENDNKLCQLYLKCGNCNCFCQCNTLYSIVNIHFYNYQIFFYK